MTDNEQQEQAGSTTPADTPTDKDWGLSGALGDIEQVASTDTAGQGEEDDLSDWAAALAEQDGMDQDQKTPQPGMDSFQDFSEPARKSAHTDIEMILDIPVQITAELGRTRMDIRNLLRLAHGSVIELDGMAGEPMDVLVNGCLIARGEVVVVNDRFGIRLTDIITPAERIRKLNHQ